MAELLKNAFSKDFFEKLSKALDQVLESFNKEQFLLEIFDNGWDKRELKERMRHVSTVLKLHLSPNFKESAQQLLEILAITKVSIIDKENPMSGLPLIFIPDYIECVGIDDLDTSVAAMEQITQVMSCEFAVRPFIIKYEDKMMDQMKLWSKHKSEHVRRLSSEGSRPRLPWAMALPALKKNPQPIIPILETLKNDSSEYVRRSVANNLNDISKDNPQVVIDMAKKWMGESKEVDWVIKHACRTLLKAGNSEVMQFFGFASPDNIVVNNLNIKNECVKIGGELEFSFDLCNRSSKSEKIRLEYAIYYMKQNGSLSKKVYKISEKNYAANETVKVNKRQSFKLISTRKFHKGKHLVSVIINGVETEEKEFVLE